MVESLVKRRVIQNSGIRTPNALSSMAFIGRRRFRKYLIRFYFIALSLDILICNYVIRATSSVVELSHLFVLPKTRVEPWTPYHRSLQSKGRNFPSRPHHEFLEYNVRSIKHYRNRNYCVYAIPWF